MKTELHLVWMNLPSWQLCDCSHINIWQQSQKHPFGQPKQIDIQLYIAKNNMSAKPEVVRHNQQLRSSRLYYIPSPCGYGDRTLKCFILVVWVLWWFRKLGQVHQNLIIHQPESVAQLDAPSDWRPGGRGFNPRWGWQHSFVEIDHEIFSTVILSLPLIQEGQFLVKECAHYWLTA